MFVFTSISPIISLSLNIQFLTDDKRGGKSRAIILVAISHYKATVDSFHVVVLAQTWAGVPLTSAISKPEF